MSLIKCPKCGEMFSDSYKTCPFCEEDEAYYGGRVKKSRGRRTQENRKRRAPSILGPVVVVVLVLLAALVVWLIFGDQIKELITGEKPPIEEVQPNPGSTIDKPDDPVVTPTISLNRAILALTVGDKETLKVNGTEDAVSWESSDPAVVSVTSGGELDTGDLKAAVGIGALYRGDPFAHGELQLQLAHVHLGGAVDGTTAAVTWSAESNNGVATVSGDTLKVTGSSSGRYTTLTGKVGDATIKLVVRIR
mgnify:CR=1 FL=1